MNVLIDMPVLERLLHSLQEMEGIKLTVVEPSDKPRALPEDQIANTEILFCTFPPSNHEKMEHLKLIQISSAGYAQLTGQKLEDTGISCGA